MKRDVFEVEFKEYYNKVKQFNGMDYSISSFKSDCYKILFKNQDPPDHRCLLQAAEVILKNAIKYDFMLGEKDVS